MDYTTSTGTRLRYSYKQLGGRTRATTTFQFMCNKISLEQTEGAPISVIVLPTNSVNKLHEGPPLVLPQINSISFKDNIAKWGGTWMWEGVNATQRTKEDTTWIAEGMQERDPDLDHRRIIQ